MRPPLRIWLMAAVSTLAALPVAALGLSDWQVDDCRRAGELLETDATGVVASDRSTWLRERFGTVQWTEGALRDREAGFRLSYTFLRSYDLPRVYYRPENALVPGSAPSQRDIERVDSPQGPVPLHRPFYDTRVDQATRRIAGYVLFYRGRAVSNPYLEQVLSAPTEILRGRTPMTLLLVQGRVSRWRACAEKS